MSASWQPRSGRKSDNAGEIVYNPDGSPSFEHGYQVEVLVDDAGKEIAMLEDFGYAAYPCAINAKTGNLERGGPHTDRVAAILWAERVAGLHPVKAGDERPPFYYESESPK